MKTAPVLYIVFETAWNCRPYTGWDTVIYEGTHKKALRKWQKLVDDGKCVTITTLADYENELDTWHARCRMG